MPLQGQQMSLNGTTAELPVQYLVPIYFMNEGKWFREMESPFLVYRELKQDKTLKIPLPMPSSPV